MRFVGSVAWRQNDQTFDGAKATITALPGLTALYAYIGNVNRIFSDQSSVGNVNSNVHLMHLESKETKVGTFASMANSNTRTIRPMITSPTCRR